MDSRVEILRSLIPFPIVRESGDVSGGAIISAPEMCEICSHKECADYQPDGASGPTMYTCREGASVAVMRIGSDTLRICGILDHRSSTADATTKKLLRKNKLPFEQLVKLEQQLQEAASRIDERTQEIAADQLGALHEIKSLFGTMYQSVEQAVFRDYHADDIGRLRRENVWLFNLYQACGELNRYFQLVDVVANPNAASYGMPFKTDVYKLVNKYVELYRHKAESTGLTIQLRGRSHLSASIYKSFPLVISVLLDNAIKYSSRNEAVLIDVDDRKGSHIEIAVSTVGRLVAEDMRRAIFMKGVRGRNVGANPGSGIGLYVAQKICEVHSCSITYEAVRFDGADDHGANNFRLLLPASMI